MAFTSMSSHVAYVLPKQRSHSTKPAMWTRQLPRLRGTIPAMVEAPPLTDLIRRAQEGDPQAFKAVFDTTYEELTRLARMRLNKTGRSTVLDTSALVHETYLRFVNAGNLRVEDRQHFLRYTSHVMRSVVVDLVRRKAAERRGGSARPVTLSTNIRENTADHEDEILRVHAALDELAALNARLAQVVEMRYFAGLTEAEIADALGIGERTVRRDWEKARVLLAEALA
jgi:RNA polymerase sigma factor (TIGR02999 family)